jgi:hypothetical protein
MRDVTGAAVLPHEVLDELLALLANVVRPPQLEGLVRDEPDFAQRGLVRFYKLQQLRFLALLRYVRDEIGDGPRGCCAPCDDVVDARGGRLREGRGPKFSILPIITDT